MLLSKQPILLLLSLIIIGRASAQQTIILTENNSPYTEQSWIYSGLGNAFPEKDVKEKWDEGKRITSIAYTNKGWFLVMAKNTGIGMQTKRTDSNWPSSWIKNNWDDNYYITTIAKSSSQWVVVMSKGEGYSGQAYIRDSWTNVASWISNKWNENYYITDVCYTGTNWAVVMSKHSKYTDQGYLWINNTKEMNDIIEREVWKKGYNLQMIEYGAGNFLVVYCKYNDNNSRIQGYGVNNKDVKEYIKNSWNESRSIIHIGGGYGTGPQMSSYNSPKKSTNRVSSPKNTTPSQQTPKVSSQQPSKNLPQQPATPSSRTSPPTKPSSPSFPAGGYKQTFLVGFLGQYNITSCLDLKHLGLDAMYEDWGGGMVFNNKNSQSKSSSNEFIWSFIFCSAKTIPGGDWFKFMTPMDWRWFRGWDGFQFYFGLGVQYNCLVRTVTSESYNLYYGAMQEDLDFDYEAHQFGANFQAGVLLFNSNSKIHLLLGGKWHQPIIGESMGSYLNNNGKIDFSEDKKTLVFAATLSLSLGSSVLMLEYDLPLGGKKQQPQPGMINNFSTKPSFFESQSQSFTLTWLFGG